jgi:hypothetical protein
MSNVERRRCPHCVGLLSAVPVDGADFVERIPAILCERCDRGPTDDEPLLLLPSDWE